MATGPGVRACTGDRNSGAGTRAATERPNRSLRQETGDEGVSYGLQPLRVVPASE